MSTFTRVQTIFYSGGHAFRGNAEPINDIAFLLDNGYLTLAALSIGTKQAYRKLLDNVIAQEHAYNLAAGGGKNHIALKLLSGEYLKKQGFDSVLYEHPFCGYYPDVMTKNTSVIIECGHTQNPEKMLTYFQQGNIKKCIQIPYPEREDVYMQGFCFSAGKELKEFLNFLERDRIRLIN
ncbi:hypothetical protein BK004_03385 [bacterium CG10_46_32]|nr:MAG: hypothetical protein BK004_03385 [bacterium CG10_46_32]PIR55968.1 MAG: hypothetical protein COU73_03415 [Parcubacteria group bacterium CG10_big_fil_rev_8_21_14_0_10_46_32]